MHHRSGVCSQHSAIEHCDRRSPPPCQMSRLYVNHVALRGENGCFYTYFGRRISPNINTATPNLVSIRPTSVPFVMTNFVKIRQTNHTYEAKNFQIAHQNFMKERVFKFVTFPQPAGDPVRKLLHRCTTTFLPLYKGIKVALKLYIILLVSCAQTNHFRPHFRTALESLTNYGAATKSAIGKFLPRDAMLARY